MSFPSGGTPTDNVLLDVSSSNVSVQSGLFSVSGKDAYTYWPLTGTQPVSGGNPDSALITTAHGNVIKVEVTNFNPSVASYITNYKLTVQQANVGGADSFVLYYASGFDALNSPPPGPYPANTAYTINIANITPPATPPTISAAFSPTSISTAGGTSTLTLTITNTNASTALSGVAVAAASLPANLTGSSPATTCGGTASFAGGSLSLSGGALAAGTTTSCTVTLTVSSTVAGNYSYTTGVVSASSPAVTGTTATTPTPLTVVAPVTATQAIASKTLTQSAAATSFTPVTGSGGTAPLSYSVSPPLPSGLSMSSATGAITGTPTVASVATTYTVTVTDATSATATNTFSLTVNSAVTATQSVASKTLTQNAAATPFTPVTGGGGTTPYTYGISPSLPAGLSFNTTTGQVTGTPTATSGTTTYTVTVTDANNGTATNTFALTVNSAVTATQAVASKTLTQNVAATSFTPVTGGGGTTPLAYTISPPLPSGLTISSSTGAITGTPTVTTGATTYTVTVTDANNGTASNTFTLTVNGALTATQAIASTTLTVNHAASPFTPVTGSGGTSPLVYSILPTLPTGLSFNTSTGAITGTPTAASVATTYTVTVTDANSGTASNTFQLTINGAVTATQSVATKTLTQNAAATSFTPVTGSGGTSPLHYSVSPPLPNGLSIDNNSGAVTGTPTASSVATTYTVTVTDANSATASNTFILTINAAVTATQAVSSASLTQNHAITPFTPVTGGGGTGTLSYSISPTLPAGLTLSSSTGSVSGTPTASNATATYTVTVTDTNGGTASNTFQLTVNGPLTATQVIASKSLTVSFPISSFAPVTGAGGTGTLTYSVSPTLPPGVAMSPSNGSISGLPTITSAVTTYTVTVTDSNSATATATFQLTVNGPVTATQTVPSKSLTAGTAATSFTPVTGGGGTTPLVYSVSPTLPNGLTLSTATGAVTGTPSAASPTTTYTVTVTDANSATATNTFSLTVNGGVTATQAIATKSLITNSAATPFTPVTGGGGTAPLTYTISPALPAGLTLTSSTGAIGGTPTSASPLTTYTVTVTDANGATATATFQLAVYDAASVTGIVPNSGPTGGGTSVTITGTGFLGASAVKFGATNATSFTVNSTTQITAVSPAGAAGAVSLTVTAPGGTASTTYTYVNLLGLVSTPSPTTQVGQPYSQTNVASGGTSPFTYAVTAGALPPGTSLNASTGLVSGTPSSGGNFSYTIKVTDSSPTQQTATQTVTGAMTTAASTTTVTSSVNPSTVGQSVTFSATVTASGAGVPTGTVTFKDGNTAIGSGALSGGTATFTTAALTLGAHSITASYTGSGNYGASTSQALQQTVNIPADSLKLRALQVNVTRVIAQNSGQAISGAIDSAISEGFSDGGGSFITPSGMGMRFNFAADLDQTQATSGDKIVTDRWNGMVGRDGGKADAQGALGYSGRKHTDDAFAAIDRAAPATKAPPLKAREPQDWILWADVRGSGIDRWGSTMNSGQAPLSGSQVNALMGLTHRVAPNFLLGVVGGYETFDYTSQEFNGKLKGDGWTVGGYLGWKLTPSIRFDAATAYSGINYNGTSGTAQGNFNGNRWLVSGGLTGAYKAWGFDIEPSVRVYALWEHENAYTDSLGTVQDSLNFATGRASGGLKVAYPFAWTETVMLAPYAGVYADYYFTKDDAAAIVAAGALPLASTPLLDGWSARVEGGLAAKFANGAAILAGGELGGIGGNVQIWTLRARARVPF